MSRRNGGNSSQRAGFACLLWGLLVAATLPGTQTKALGAEAGANADHTTGEWTLRYRFEEGETLRMKCGTAP